MSMLRYSAPPTTAAAVPKLETFTDDFTTGLDKITKWPNSSTAAVWDAIVKRAELPCNSSYTTLGAETVTGYSLTGSYIYARVTCPPIGNGSRETTMEVARIGGATDQLSMFVSGSSLYARMIVGGSNSGQTSVTYNSTNHAWWRISEASGTVYFHTSPDGTTWTQLWSVAPGFAVTQVAADFTCGYWGTETVASGYVDNVNIPVGPTAVGLPIGFVNSSGTKQAANLVLWDGVQAKEIYDAIIMSPTKGSVADITTATTSNPVYLAHRGCSANWPEMTQWAYTHAQSDGMKALELSVQYTSDGVYCLSHDADTSRVCDTTVTIGSTPWSTMQTLLVKKPTGAAGISPATYRFTRVEEPMDLWCKDHLIMLEDKTYNHPELFDYMASRYGANAIKQQIVMKLSGPNPNSFFVNKAAALGLKTWGYFFSTWTPGSDTSWNAYDFLGVDTAYTDSQVSQFVATGKPCIAHIISTSAQRDRMLGLGCVGFMCSNVFVLPSLGG